MSVRTEVSPSMRRTRFVAGLTQRLGDRLIYTTGSVPRGYLRADTIEREGFSLRVNAPGPGKETVSLLHITGSRVGKIAFPSRLMLDERMPHRGAEVESYAQFLYELRLDIGEFRKRQKPALPHSIVSRELDRLSDCVLALA